MDPEFEPMEQDCEDDGDDTLQVAVHNDLFKNDGNEDILDFEETDDLEITDFTRRNDEASSDAENKDVSNGSPVERISIHVENVDDGSAKEDGEISETQSHSGGSDIDDNSNTQYFSRSSSKRSSRRKNDIRRERSPVARQYPNPYLEFDDDKIKSRALRFGLANPSTTTTSAMNTEESVQLSDDDLLHFYITCGIIQDDGGKLTLDKVSGNYRLDSILIRGTNHMNTNEIFKYLYDLGQKPITMEWVNDAMCVVVFKNAYESAAALQKISKPILMDPRLVERKRSIIQAENTEDKEENTDEKKESVMNEDFDYDKHDTIPQSWITVPMPPGYVWRFGAPCEKAKGILMRFATKQDKKQERAERFSEYYKNYGNPNKIGGNTKQNFGDRDDSRRRRKKLRPENHSSSLDSPKDEYPSRKSSLKLGNPNDKNGWSQLSAMWDDEEAFQRTARDRDRFSTTRQNSSETEAVGISPMKKQESSKDANSIPSKTIDARDILKTRHKRKRGSNSSDEEELSDSNNDEYDDNDDDDRSSNVNDWKDNGSFRRKRESRNDDDGDKIQWRERLSAPRMRMHADEEEERIKRRAFRRLGHKRGDSSLQTNYWDFSRDHSNNSSFRSKAGSRRPVSERLGARRNLSKNTDTDDQRNGDGFPSSSGFDLRQKLINMRRDNDEEGEEEDLHNLIFYDEND